jgi:hypothetical protein
MTQMNADFSISALNRIMPQVLHIEHLGGIHPMRLR